MISAPACYGKLPSLGDYFQHGAAHGEVATWWDRFARLQEWCKTRNIPATLPWCFVLPPSVFSWSGKNHVIGVLCMSSDSIGRRYPFVVWQKASIRGLQNGLFAASPLQEAMRKNWLFWLSRLVAAQVSPYRDGSVSGVGSAQDFERRLARLWELYRPDWRTRFGIARPLPQEDSVIPIVGSPPSGRASGLDSDLEGVHYMPWADWPERLWAAKAPCCFWQQDHAGNYLRVFRGNGFSLSLFLEAR